MQNRKLKMSLMALALGAALVTPAFADDTPAGVADDVQAVQKDNVAIGKNDAKLAKHRASKAKNKANGNWTGQASDSVKIGADKAMNSEKKTEKDYDTKTLDSDVDSVKGQ